MKRNEREHQNLILCKNCGGYYDPAEENCPHCGEETSVNTKKTRESAMDVTKYGGGFGSQDSGLTRAALVIVIILLLEALIAVGVLGVKAFQLLYDDQGEDSSTSIAEEVEADTSAEGDVSAAEEEVDSDGVSSISLSNTAISLSDGESILLEVTVDPEDWTGELTWSTSNQYVATVDEYGRVTYVGGGECTVSVSNGDISAECLVECSGDAADSEAEPASVQGSYPISAPEDEEQEEPDDDDGEEEETPSTDTTENTENTDTTETTTESLTLNYPDITMAKVGDGTQLVATGGDGTYQWSSADSSIATVSDSGMVIGVSPGTTTVTCTSGSESVTCIVRVKGAS